METLQVPSELQQMLELYRQAQPKAVLEIGSWDGGTLKCWLTEASPELVVAVDLEHRNKKAYREWVKPGCQLETITGDSHHWQVMEQVKALGPYDWVLIDGDHTEQGVREDWRLVTECLLPGAIVCFHDVARGLHNIGDPGPRILFEGLKAEGLESEEFVEEPYEGPWAHGVGVVYP